MENLRPFTERLKLRRLTGRLNFRIESFGKQLK